MTRTAFIASPPQQQTIYSPIPQFSFTAPQLQPQPGLFAINPISISVPVMQKPPSNGQLQLFSFGGQVCFRTKQNKPRNELL